MTSFRFFQVAFWSMLTGVCLMLTVAISKPEMARERILVERGLISPPPTSPLPVSSLMAAQTPVPSTATDASSHEMPEVRRAGTSPPQGAQLLPELASDGTSDVRNRGTDDTWSDVRFQARDVQVSQNDSVPRQYASRPLDVISSSVHRLRDSSPADDFRPWATVQVNERDATGVMVPTAEPSVRIDSVEPLLTAAQREPTLEEQLVAKIAELQQRLNKMELAERQKRIELLERATLLLERWEKIGQVTVPEPSTLNVDPQPLSIPPHNTEPAKTEPVQTAPAKIEPTGNVRIPVRNDSPEENEDDNPQFIPPTLLDDSEKRPGATSTSGVEANAQQMPRAFPPPHLALRKLEPVESVTKTLLVRDTQSTIADIERVIHTRDMPAQTMMLPAQTAVLPTQTAVLPTQAIAMDVQLFSIRLNSSHYAGITGQLLSKHRTTMEDMAGRIVRPPSYGKVGLYAGDSMELLSMAERMAPVQRTFHQQLALQEGQWGNLLTTPQAHFFSCCHASQQGILKRGEALGQSSRLVAKVSLLKNGKQVLLKIATATSTLNDVDASRVLAESIVSSGTTLLLGNVFTNQPVGPPQRSAQPANLLRSEWILAVTPQMGAVQ